MVLDHRLTNDFKMNIAGIPSREGFPHNLICI
jgi:hypothetical protein